MKSRIIILIAGFITVGVSSCVVSKKKFEELAQKKSNLEVDKGDLQKANRALKSELSTTTKTLSDCNTQVEDLVGDTTIQGELFRDLQSKYSNLEGVSDQDARNLSLQLKKVGDLKQTLETQNELIETEKKRIESLNGDLIEREKRIAELQKNVKDRESKVSALQSDVKDRESKVSKLQKDLNSREKRVQELEKLIAQKEASVKAMKDKISKALLGFNKDELTVNVEDGKIHVSLEEQLLFQSGSYKIDTKGEQALVKLAEALSNNSDDFSVMVEGHTDDVPYNGSGVIKDNWDLSVLRATSIVKVLVKNKLDPKKVIASGRGEFLPKVAGKTKENRAKNRRIEIIIIPNMDELLKMLED